MKALAELSIAMRTAMVMAIPCRVFTVALCQPDTSRMRATVMTTTQVFIRAQSKYVTAVTIIVMVESMKAWARLSIAMQTGMVMAILCRAFKAAECQPGTSRMREIVMTTTRVFI